MFIKSNRPRFISLLMSFVSLMGASFLSMTSLSFADQMIKSPSGLLAQKIAASVPAEIPEMITGGKWRKGNIGGFYRAMVILPNTKIETTQKRSASVVIQWIGKEDGSSLSKVFKSVNLPEVSHKKLQYAYLSMDTLKDNEMTLLVSSFDAEKNKDIAISFKATLPGEYKSK